MHNKTICQGGQRLRKYYSTNIDRGSNNTSNCEGSIAVSPFCLPSPPACVSLFFFVLFFFWMSLPHGRQWKVTIIQTNSSSTFHRPCISPCVTQELDCTVPWQWAVLMYWYKNTRIVLIYATHQNVKLERCVGGINRGSRTGRPHCQTHTVAPVMNGCRRGLKGKYLRHGTDAVPSALTHYPAAQCQSTPRSLRGNIPSHGHLWAA